MSTASGSSRASPTECAALSMDQELEVAMDYTPGPVNTGKDAAPPSASMSPATANLRAAIENEELVPSDIYTPELESRVGEVIDKLDDRGIERRIKEAKKHVEFGPYCRAIVKEGGLEPGEWDFGQEEPYLDLLGFETWCLGKAELLARLGAEPSPPQAVQAPEPAQALLANASQALALTAQPSPPQTSPAPEQAQAAPQTAAKASPAPAMQQPAESSTPQALQASQEGALPAEASQALPTQPSPPQTLLAPGLAHTLPPTAAEAVHAPVKQPAEASTPQALPAQASSAMASLPEASPVPLPARDLAHAKAVAPEAIAAQASPQPSPATAQAQIAAGGANMSTEQMAVPIQQAPPDAAGFQPHPNPHPPTKQHQFDRVVPLQPAPQD